MPCPRIPLSCVCPLAATLSLLVLVAVTWDREALNEHLMRLPQSIQSLSGQLWCPEWSVQARLEGPLEYNDPELLGLIRDQYLTPPSPDPYNLGDEDKDYSSYKQEVFFIAAQAVVRHYFKDVRNGVFVEAGALDGEYLSNTLGLEKDQGWTGLLVEPDYAMHQRILRKKRKAWVAKACLATKPYPHKATLAAVPDKVRPGQSWFMTRRGGTALLETRSIAKRLASGFPVYERVQCLPLASLLLALNITRVDFISLDVEDVEDHIIDHFPFDRIEVDVWYVEHLNWKIPGSTSSEEHDLEFVNKFTSKGYTFRAMGDYIFVRNGSSYGTMSEPRPPVVSQIVKYPVVVG